MNFIVRSQQEYQGLMDSVVSTGHPVLRKPIFFLGLKREEYADYAYNLITDFGIVIDTQVVGQIIDNSVYMDKRSWRSYDMRRTILVKNSNTTISKGCIDRHLKYLSPKEVLEFKEAIAYYNSQLTTNRNVISFSRPVFSNDKQYAAIRYSSLYRFGVDLYRFYDGAWHSVGPLIVGGY